MLIFSIGSVSSQTVNDIDNATNNKLIKSNLTSSLSTKTTTVSTENKVKTNTTKVTSVNKTDTTKKTTNKTSTKKNNKTTTVNKKTLARTSTSFMNSVNKNGKFPKVKISNKNYSNTEYLYLMSKAVENNSKTKIEIGDKLVKPYNNTKCKSVKGTINKTEYVKIAGKTRKFIEKNQRAPNWASSSKGNIPYNQLILMFGKCLDTYNKTNKLPNSIKLDDLDLDVIKNKINKKAATSSVKKTTNKTNKSGSAKTNSTKTNKNSTVKSTAKKANATTTKTTTKKTNATTTKTTAKTTVNKTAQNKVDGADNGSLIERSINQINNILNNILDKLNPSKYQIDLTKSDEANVKFNTSKVNVDVNGKSTVNVKVSAKDNKTATKAKASTKKSTTKKTTTKSNAKTTTSGAKKTNSTKKTTSKTSTKKSTNISSALKKYLSSSKNCQVNNKQIKELAKKLTSSLKTDYKKARKLFNWVRDNIQYEKYGNTRKGALKTLKKKQGNCVDQSHLLVALSRAAGIPARYVNGGNCKFTSGYVSGHVWTQMYVNKKWVVADPTSSRNTLGKIKNWNTKSYTHYGEYSSINF